jgi:HSP20 family protein
MEMDMMLMRTDPFRQPEPVTHRMSGTNGTAARPGVMPMDAWLDGDVFRAEFDLPGVDRDSIDVGVQRNVVTVQVERPARLGGAELIAAERPRGVFSRQLILGADLDTDQIAASYDAGVLTLTIPLAARAAPRRISLTPDQQAGNA